MPARKAMLTDQQDAFVSEQVAQGRYQNASELVREGVRLVQRRAELRATGLDALRGAARAGLDDLDAGRYDAVPLDRVGGYVAGLGQEARDRARGAG